MCVCVYLILWRVEVGKSFQVRARDPRFMLSAQNRLITIRVNTVQPPITGVDAAIEQLVRGELVRFELDRWTNTIRPDATPMFVTAGSKPVGGAPLACSFFDGGPKLA